MGRTFPGITRDAILTLARAEAAQDEAGFFYAVASYINGFGDPHISVNATGQLPAAREAARSAGAPFPRRSAIWMGRNFAATGQIWNDVRTNRPMPGPYQQCLPALLLPPRRAMFPSEGSTFILAGPPQCVPGNFLSPKVNVYKSDRILTKPFHRSYFEA